MKRKIHKIIDMLLILTMLFTLAGPAIAEPFESGATEASAVRDTPTLVLDSPFAAMEDARPDGDAGKVDRFIVKYKSGKEASFKSKVGTQLDKSVL